MHFNQFKDSRVSACHVKIRRVSWLNCGVCWGDGKHGEEGFEACVGGCVTERLEGGGRGRWWRGGGKVPRRVYLAPNGATSCPGAVVDIWQRCPDSFGPAAASCSHNARFLIAGKSVYAPCLIKWIRRLRWRPHAPTTSSDWRAERVKEKGRGGDAAYTSCRSMWAKFNDYFHDANWWKSVRWAVSQLYLLMYKQKFKPNLIPHIVFHGGFGAVGSCFLNLCSCYVLACTFFQFFVPNNTRLASSKWC